MSDFKATMHQIVCRLGLHPRPHWGAYSAFQAPSWILGGLLLREGRRGEGIPCSPVTLAQPLHSTHWTIKNVIFYFWLQLWLILDDFYNFYIILIVKKFYTWL